MGSLIVVEVLPLLQLCIEGCCIIDHHTFQELIADKTPRLKLLVINAVGAFHFALETRCTGSDVDMPSALVPKVIMKQVTELRTGANLTRFVTATSRTAGLCSGGAGAYEYVERLPVAGAA